MTTAEDEQGAQPSASQGRTVRRASAEELPSVARLLLRSYEADYAPLSVEYRRRLARPQDRVADDDIWLAFDGTEPVATISTSRAVVDGWAHCSLLAVAPSARRRGLGAAMIGFALERARTLDADGLRLHSAEYMTAAHRLYRSLGFERMPEQDFTVAESRHATLQVWGFGRELGPRPPTGHPRLSGR
ncbi:GNAT family N-acetyltransferase [Mycetocola reblochoni]|nr:GNAT family N-acetyltransferase [Mycetocola reblochoni]